MAEKSSGARRGHTRRERQGSDESLGGFLGGLTNLVEKLGELAEKGKELHELGELPGSTDALRGVYGFSIRTNLGGDQGTYKVEPFGNVKRDARTGKATVRETLEPLVDVFEEPDHVLVVAEMPGIGPDDVQLELHADVLTISATRGKKKYSKQVTLPAAFPPGAMASSCRNGVLEIRFASTEKSNG